MPNKKRSRDALLMVETVKQVDMFYGTSERCTVSDAQDVVSPALKDAEDDDE